MVLSKARILLPTRTTRLRFLAHTRHIVGVMLPLGAAVGLLVALALFCLERFEPWIQHLGGRTRLTLLLPAAGLFLTTAWLRLTRLGEVSLARDLDLARTDPYQAFPFLRSLGKVVGCALTIGFGGSAGIEGPGKWFGAAMGLQYHRVLRTSANYLGVVRRLARPPLVMARAGAASALAAVFRAPLSGALMAAEHHGHLAAESLIPCLVSAASGYVVFSGLMGYEPLLPLPRGMLPLRARELAWALGLGLLCGLAATLYLRVRKALDALLGRSPLLWRGLAAGTGLCLLALPGHLLFHDLPVTQGGGLELIKALLQGGTLPGHATAYLVLKLAATALTFAGGGIGGLWLPSLTMGCALGTAFDGFLHLGTQGYLTLVGGAAMAGATNESLLVPVVFLAETTGQAALVVPALVATTVSYVVVREGS
ncbi:chloride channel protein [Geothrix sp. 21YS21S-2]|uniref:chloride channel protein n=1 Tax=Geothrix sp. 21YS21S-2 TaxID=3068893 RepID=UPI0027BA3AFD|nr:chloride channel protein [Geothrix sp. 21YS21S-2]